MHYLSENTKSRIALSEKIYNIIEFTQRNVFLTGKAGTGKTTFLNDFIRRTIKNCIVVAPTGIAAINAGGVTIHSMFGLPLTSFMPTTDPVDRNEAINIPQLLPHFKYRKEKLELLRALEILIIDEVSMLRADVLDMIDLALKTARRSALAFGGVQLLLIGDLYQLPPVVKAASEKLLAAFYTAPYFFESKALKSTPFVTIELTTVFRQSDPVFIALLNAIREGETNGIDFQLLNTRYQPGFEPKDRYVYLVSHNYMADGINTRRLEALPGKGISCPAIITGDFKEQLYPNDPNLVLKPEAQVMFIRNDASESKKYYNGRLAKVLRAEDDRIIVLPEGAETELAVEREIWENKKYYLDDKKEIKEDVIGSYEQYPFRLAWAVTIHKSQGLTFDRVIIDAGASFTSGQVYVALSRCRTLDGIVLKSPIRASNIFRDTRISDFHEATNASEKMELIYETEKHAFAVSKLLRTLSCAPFLTVMENWIQAGREKEPGDAAVFAGLSEQVQENSRKLEDTFIKFESFVQRKMRDPEPGTWALISEKGAGAVNYFFDQVQERVLMPVKAHYDSVRKQKGLKSYVRTVEAFMNELEAYLLGLANARFLDQQLLAGEKNIEVHVKEKDQPSHLVTYNLLEEGKTPDEIAAERNLAISTIYGHFARVAQVGILDISALFSEEQLQVFNKAFEPGKWPSVTAAKSALPVFEFHELRVLINHFTYWANKAKQSEKAVSL
ncbi:helix-turn-helix domain-containing protein [Niabella drilacis]|uniref:UvrD-like helicase C-terminal domain-containing protein n=1 Tax=Niabella drilacis (strain DSM 25811 / CCM 8410 / CCUG 62505 / LMG 26954 / E90) TaxID=1285928 RepID=A0A1G6N155_NIADE|nr:helix-turn-helix domain-containing protein [Niabella drilacis]SDC60845.1 UvrD-like helicase C-terminal domain-containing protein [Niabella drilacis]